MTISANEIRRSFLKYFERQGHRVVPSAPLVPHDDPTLLFTNAGMNQFKDVFLGRDTRDYRRAATAQKCMRVSGKHNDLDNVGPSLRHHTFFEMLGNFSFGDYFKKEAIPFAWALITGEWKIPPDRLFATVFRGEAGIPRDEEAYDVWAKCLPRDRIGELGTGDNFWQMGETGPCGRCSEIYYYRGPEIPCSEEGQGGCRGPECSCDRYIEIWNNVFMEFDRQADGTLKPLPAPSIDTGMGLERITAVLQGHLSNYDTDLFTPLLNDIGRYAGTKHTGSMNATDISMRVIADHMRAMTFLIADGVYPASEKRGSALRRIMRRAMRHKNRLGIMEPMLGYLVDTVVREFGDAYPELRSGRGAILHVIQSEERRFEETLARGLPPLEDVLDEAAASGGVVSGDAAFRLYETFGLPRDFIEDMIDERKLTFDRVGFERALEAQRQKARTKSKFGPGTTAEKVGWVIRGGGELDADEFVNAKDTFVGYDRTEAETKILALFNEQREQVASLTAGQHGYVFLRETPFYLESGGQVSDSGTIATASAIARVDGVERGPALETPRAHRVNVERGTFRHKEPVRATVDVSLRDATRRNHTATHLLHAALRQVLGDHVKQAGSLVAHNRFRFDFVHFSALTSEQWRKIERIVNEQVLRNTPIQTETKNTREAIAAGAMALFGEKYGEQVRVVSVPGFSTELCGGTHVRATGDIGLFAIQSESGVAAGVRRIEAITGVDSVEWLQWLRFAHQTLESAIRIDEGPPSMQALKRIGGFPESKASQVLRSLEVIAKLRADLKRTNQELQQAKMAAALGGGAAGAPEEAIEVGGVKLVAREVSGLDKDGLRALVDEHRSRIKSGVVILAQPSDGKVAIVVGVTPDLTKKVPAGQIVKQIAPIVGGGGGGRPDFAEAGGKDPSKIAEMLAASRGIVEKMLGA